MWALRGLRDGVVPPRWPARPDPYAAAVRGPATVVAPADADDRLDRLCPTGAISRADATVRLDQGKCVQCGRCGAARPDVVGGSDGTEEWEILALFNPVYDAHRLGIFLTASPRHADILLVTGAGARGMTEPLRQTYDAMPDPKIVIAVGTDAVSGGLASPSYAVTGGIGAVVPVYVWLPGAPPTPFSILHALLLAPGRLPGGAGEGGRS